MIPKTLYSFSGNETLSVRKLIDNFKQMYKDLQDSRNRAWIYGSFTVDLTGLPVGTGSSNERNFRLNPPLNLEIIGIGIEVYSNGVAGTVESPVNFSLLTASIGAAAGTRTYKYVKFSRLCTAGVDFSINWQVTTSPRSLKITYYYRVSRIDVKNYIRFISGLTHGSTNSASVLNTAFTDYETEVNANIAANADFTIDVVSRRNTPTGAISTNSRDFRLPSRGQTLSVIKHYLWGTVTANAMTLDVITGGGAGSTLATSTLTANGSTIQTATLTVNSIQPNAPTLPASDYVLRNSRSGANTLEWYYAVIFST
jgi:hypothetical protein